MASFDEIVPQRSIVPPQILAAQAFFGIRKLLPSCNFDVNRVV